MDRKPLFPGRSCYPLSPDRHARIQANGFAVSKDDQLAVIFEILGTPEEADIAFVTDAKALTYLKSFQPIKRVDLQEKYPGADQESIDLLNKMLQINPYFRISVEDALSHPCFAKIKKESKELASENPVTIEFDDQQLDKPTLRKLFLKACAEI